MDAQNGDPHPRTTLLFVTNSESGQANTILAMALEALTRPHVEVHIASFPALKRLVEKLDLRLNFHPLDGKSMAEAGLARGFSVGDLAHPPLCKSLVVDSRALWLGHASWDGECGCRFPSGVRDISDDAALAYMRIYQSIMELIKELNPGVVAVDNFFNPGLDACLTANRKFVMTSPNTPLDITRVRQPWLKGFWYYPMFVLLPTLFRNSD